MNFNNQLEIIIVKSIGKTINILTAFLILKRQFNYNSLLRYRLLSLRLIYLLRDLMTISKQFRLVFQNLIRYSHGFFCMIRINCKLDIFSPGLVCLS